MQAAQPRDPLGAGAEHQVVGVGEDDLGAGRGEHVDGHGLDGGGGADGHEGRGLDPAEGGGEAAAAGGTVLGQEVEADHGAGSARVSRQASP